MMVVKLNEYKALLAAFDAARAAILRGECAGAAICMTDTKGEETVIFAGSYLTDRHEALKGALHMSWELTKGRDFEQSELE